MNDKTVDVLIDESGIFWNTQDKNILTLVSFAWLPSTNCEITGLEQLESRLASLKNPGGFHTAPLVHGNSEYKEVEISIRRSIFKTFQLFAQKTNICSDSFIINPRYHTDPELQRSLLLRYLATKFDNASAQVDLCRKIHLCYDDGQPELTSVLSEFASMDPKLELVISQEHKRSRVFHVADFATFVDRLVYKMSHGVPLSKTELQFFDKKSLKVLAKNFKQ